MPTPAAAHVVVTPKVHYVGTPVALLGTAHPDGSINLAPMSSYWALGPHLVLGLETDSRTYDNVAAHPEITVNFPSPSLWASVEVLADTTGREEVPAAKLPRTRFAADKFTEAHLTPVPSDLITPPRVKECALQFETRVRRITPGVGDYAIVEAEVVRVHALPEIVKAGTQHIDPRQWQPTIYSFRHYFGLGSEVGHRPTSDTHGDLAV